MTLTLGQLLLLETVKQYELTFNTIHVFVTPCAPSGSCPASTGSHGQYLCAEMQKMTDDQFTTFQQTTLPMLIQFRQQRNPVVSHPLQTSFQQQPQPQPQPQPHPIQTFAQQPVAGTSQGLGFTSWNFTPTGVVRTSPWRPPPQHQQQQQQKQQPDQEDSLTDLFNLS